MPPLQQALSRLTRAVESLDKVIGKEAIATHQQEESTEHIQALQNQMSDLNEQCESLKKQLTSKYQANLQIRNQVDRVIDHLERLLDNK